MATNKEKAIQKKNEGNEFFKARDFSNAALKYGEGIALDPTNHILYSNRSMALAACGRWEEAAGDGLKCVELDPGFLKGYHRAGNALLECKRYAEAAKLADQGVGRWPLNDDLKALLEKAKPLAEKAEKDRRRKLRGPDKIKEEGNDLFKAAKFEEAIAKYTEALGACRDRSTPVALAILNNRAACFKQLGSNRKVIEDCTQVLEHDPKNPKALLRRALAFEAMERYRSALQDIREALSINPGWKVANDAQHRIGTAVRYLKQQGRSI